MKFLDTLRDFDMFGSPISLKRKGQSTYPSAGGGLVSVGMRVFILSFFCMKLIDVMSYTDPQISSFAVLDDRIQTK